MSKTVTSLVNSTKQPRGGYIPVKLFQETCFESESELYPEENISKSLIGLTVDNMTRVMLGSNPEEVFEPAFAGMMCVKADIVGSTYLIHDVVGLDDASILSAYKLSVYESIYRNGYPFSNTIKEVPDEHTIENIREMVKRSLVYFEKQADIVNTGRRLSAKYRNLSAINQSEEVYGDYDYLTEDSLIDMKVLSQKITSQHSLQIFLYWLLGTKTKKSRFSKVKYLKFYNPRLNIEYSFDLDKATPELINPILEEVLKEKGK